MTLCLFLGASRIQNQRMVSRVIDAPTLPAAESLHQAGKENARALLLQLAAEQNRWFTAQVEWLQLALGLGLLLILVFGTRPPKIPILLTLVMFLIVLTEKSFVTARLVDTGRLLDFAPPAELGATRTNHALYLGIHSALELAKLVLGFTVAGLFLFRGQPDPQMFVKESEWEAAPPPRGRKP